MNVLQMIQGYKTYFTAFAVGVLLFGVWQHWWVVPTEVYAGLSALMMVFLRNGVKNDVANAMGQGTQTTQGTQGTGAARLPVVAWAGLMGAALLIGGCSSFYNGAQNTRATAVDLAYGAYGTWTNYYCLQTNMANATPARLQQLAEAEATAKQARLRFAATVGVLDGWLSTYQTNSAVQGQLQASLDATVASASNIVWLVNYFQH